MKAPKNHKFITISSLTVIAILSTNCSSIKTYRGHPSTWKNSHPVTEKKTFKKAKTNSGKKGGLFGFFSNLRKKDVAQTQSSTVTAPKINKIAVAPIKTQPAPRLAPSNKIRPVAPITKTRPITGTSSQKRRVHGLRTPEVDNIPSKQELEEVDSPSFKPSTGPGITVPTKP